MFRRRKNNIQEKVKNKKYYIKENSDIVTMSMYRIYACLCTHIYNFTSTEIVAMYIYTINLPIKDWILILKYRIILNQ